MCYISVRRQKNSRFVVALFGFIALVFVSCAAWAARRLAALVNSQLRRPLRVAREKRLKISRRVSVVVQHRKSSVLSLAHDVAQIWHNAQMISGSDDAERLFARSENGRIHINDTLPGCSVACGDRVQGLTFLRSLCGNAIVCVAFALPSRVGAGGGEEGSALHIPDISPT